LSNPEVGAYLNRHFVSAFQKVAAFQKIHNAKVGGNVASYFSTADGAVLHIVPGPVDGRTLLREARWANETYQMSLLENQKTPAQLRAFFRKAHVDRLQNEHHVRVPAEQLPQEPALSPKTLGDLFERNWHLDNAGKVHLLLAVAPLARIDQVYQGVFEHILNEKVTTNPVAVR
jgi:hypothetical protein